MTNPSWSPVPLAVHILELTQLSREGIACEQQTQTIHYWMVTSARQAFQWDLFLNATNEFGSVHVARDATSGIFDSADARVPPGHKVFGMYSRVYQKVKPPPAMTFTSPPMVPGGSLASRIMAARAVQREVSSG